MENLNLISTHLKSGKAITKKEWSEWKKELKKSLKPSLNGVKPKSHKAQMQSKVERIEKIKSHLSELKAAGTDLKNKRNKSLVKIQQEELDKASKEIISAYNKEMISMASAEAKKSNWSKAVKILNEAIEFSRKNKALTVKPAPELFLCRAKSEFFQKGNKPAMRKGLREALKIHPKHERISHALTHYEFLAGNINDAFEVMKNLPRNKKSRNDTMLRYLLQPHTNHGGLEAFNRARGDFRVGDSLTVDGFGTDDGIGYQPDPDGFDPGIPGLKDDRFNPESSREVEITFELPGRDLIPPKLPDITPFRVLTNGAPVGIPCNFYTYQHNLVDDNFFESVSQSIMSYETDYKISKDSANQVMRVFASVHKKWNQALKYLHHRNYNAAVNCLNDAQYNALRVLNHSRRFCWDLRYSENDIADEIIPLDEGGDNSVEAIEAIEEEILKFKFFYSPEKSKFNDFLKDRNTKVDLPSLYTFDWINPLLSRRVDDDRGPANIVGYKPGFTTLRPTYYYLWGSLYDEGANQSDNIIDNMDKRIEYRYEKVDFPLIILSSIFVRLAKIEAFRFTKQYERAYIEIERLFDLHHLILHRKPLIKLYLLNPIEYCFLKKLHAQVLMEKADKEYKAREVLDAGISTDDANVNRLVAYETYKDAISVFDDWSGYRTNVNNAVNTYTSNRRLIMKNAAGDFKIMNPVYIKEMTRLGSTIADDDILLPDEKMKFKALNKSLLLSNVPSSYGETRAAIRPRNNYPWERTLNWDDTDTSDPQSNPVIYSIIFDANAMIQQIAAGLNYLGYRDDYVPPWKFSYLLDRARYLADQAKNLQRDYLNFLSNAEQEQFQELTAGQTISLERMNLNVENAKVDMANQELEVATQSRELAQLQATNAFERWSRFSDYDNIADVADRVSTVTMGLIPFALIGAGALAGAVIGVPGGPGGAMITGTAGAGLGAIAAIGTGLGSASSGIVGIAGLIKEGEQREMEEENLGLSYREACKAKEVADQQEVVALASLAVANLQAQSALMRLEFAQDTYEYLRNQFTSAEMWYRLSHTIRGVANTYLKRAIEMSFLAEQAYEFMIDKQLNVIRFDYDNDELGEMLGADFLKADLDYLESHLVFTQREKQQQVKCVISLARDFPQCMQELRDNESVIVPITLKYLEQRFPGLYNMKISAIELHSAALMDPTRFSVELTYMGSGVIRTASESVDRESPRCDITINNCALTSDDPPVLDPENLDSNWLPFASEEFPVNVLLRHVETAIFSGLSATEESSYYQSYSSQQKNAFEDCPSAAGWRIDMSMKENRIVPGSLADIVLTFYMTGYYDSNLKELIEEQNAVEETYVTNVFSAHNQFSDEYFNFQRTGNLSFKITPGHLTTNRNIRELRELSFAFLPAIRSEIHTRFQSIYIAELEIDTAGNVTEFNPMPRFFIRNTPGAGSTNMDVDITIVNALSMNAANIEVFSSENPVPIPTVVPASGSSTITFSFRRQGRQELVIRDLTAGTLKEYKIEIFVSNANPVKAPVCYYSKLEAPVIISHPATDTTPALPDTMKLIFSCKKLNSSFTEVRADGSKYSRLILIDSETGQALSNASSFSTQITSDEFVVPTANKKVVAILTYFEPMKVKFICNQDYVDLPPYDLVENRLRTNNINATTTDDATTAAFTNQLFAPPKIKSPVDNWNVKLDPAVNGFIKVYDCDGNERIDMSIFNDVLLTMEYHLTNR